MLDNIWQRMIGPEIGTIPTEAILYNTLRPLFATLEHNKIEEIETALTEYQIESAERAYFLGLKHGINAKI